jgi:hypothetical protein
MAQPFADLSNLGSSARAATAASLKGNIVGSSTADADDVPGASTQAALDRLLGGSNAHQLALDATAGHSGWQPRGRAVVATKAAAVAKPSAANGVSTSAAATHPLNPSSSLNARAPHVPAQAHDDAGAEADDDASPPSSEGRVTRDAGATPPMRIGGGGVEAAGAGDNGAADELNGRDDEENAYGDDGHESGSSGPCQLPPLAARSAIVKRRQAAAANRVSGS